MSWLFAPLALFAMWFLLFGCTYYERPLKLVANETAAAGSLHRIALANVRFAQDHAKQGFAESLPELKQLTRDDGVENNEPAIDQVLSNGEKRGYRFTYRSYSTTANRKLDAFEVSADPLVPGETGCRHFFVDQTTVVRTSFNAPASATSDPLEP